MSRRTWFKDSASTSEGLLYGQFGFISTLIGTQPNLALAFGLGGLTGYVVGGLPVAGAGPGFVQSIVKTANTGEFLITLVDGYRKLWYLDASLLGPAAGPAGGDWAQACAPVNEGLGHTTPITFLITTLNSSNAPVETNGRTIMCSLTMKDLGAGT